MSRHRLLAAGLVLTTMLASSVTAYAAENTTGAAADTVTAATPTTNEFASPRTAVLYVDRLLAMTGTEASAPAASRGTTIPSAATATTSVAVAALVTPAKKTPAPKPPPPPPPPPAPAPKPAPAPGGASPSPTPTPTPHVVGYTSQTLWHGFNGYTSFPDTPALRNGSLTRSPAIGLPPNPPFTPNPTFCMWDVQSTIPGEGIAGSNYSRGYPWQYEQAWLHKYDIWDNGYGVRYLVEVGVAQLNLYRNSSRGPCDYYNNPILDTPTCTTSIGPVTISGPTGKGLPVTNSYTGQVIPETQAKTWTVTQTNGNTWTATSAIGAAIAQGTLGGLGQNSYALGLVDGCAGFSASVPNNSSTQTKGWGNFRIDKTVRSTTCRVISYPGWGGRNFRGCSTPTATVNTNYLAQSCNPADPTTVRIRMLSSPDTVSMFDPEVMQCVTPRCVWTNDQTGQTGLPPSTIGPADDPTKRGVPLVWTGNSAPYGTLLLPTGFSTGNGLINLNADGRTVNIRAPAVAMDFSNMPASIRPTTAGTKWTTWQVEPGSTPWANSGGVPVANANAAGQPFKSMSSSATGTLSWGSGAARYLDGDTWAPNQFARDGQQPIVPWARQLVMNFYEPSDAASPTFTVRGEYHQGWNARLATGRLASVDASSVGTANNTAIQYTIVKTCATNWVTFAIVKNRLTN